MISPFLSRKLMGYPCLYLCQSKPYNQGCGFGFKSLGKLDPDPKFEKMFNPNSNTVPLYLYVNPNLRIRFQIFGKIMIQTRILSLSISLSIQTLQPGLRIQIRIFEFLLHFVFKIRD